MRMYGYIVACLAVRRHCPRLRHCIVCHDFAWQINNDDDDDDDDDIHNHSGTGMSNTNGMIKVVLYFRCISC